MARPSHGPFCTSSVAISSERKVEPDAELAAQAAAQDRRLPGDAATLVVTLGGGVGGAVLLECQRPLLGGVRVRDVGRVDVDELAIAARRHVLE